MHQPEPVILRAGPFDGKETSVGNSLHRCHQIMLPGEFMGYRSRGKFPPGPSFGLVLYDRTDEVTPEGRTVFVHNPWAANS